MSCVVGKGGDRHGLAAWRKMLTDFRPMPVLLLSAG
jgi:hypothetical protein